MTHLSCLLLKRPQLLKRLRLPSRRIGRFECDTDIAFEPALAPDNDTTSLITVTVEARIIAADAAVFRRSAVDEFRLEFWLCMDMDIGVDDCDTFTLEDDVTCGVLPLPEKA